MCTVIQEFIGPTVSFSDKRQFREQFCVHLVREGIVINFIHYVLDTCMVRLTIHVLYIHLHVQYMCINCSHFYIFRVAYMYMYVYMPPVIHCRNLQRLLMTTVHLILPLWCSFCLVWFTTWTDPPSATWLADCTCACTCTHTADSQYPTYFRGSTLLVAHTKSVDICMLGRIV